MSALSKTQKNILTFYILLLFAVATNFVPLAALQLIGFLVTIGTLIAAYVYRSRSGLDSLPYNHMTWFIRTMWIAGLFLLIGILGATAWMYVAADHGQIQDLLVRMQNTTMTEQDLALAMADYMSANMGLLVLISLVTLAPTFVYILYRAIVGIVRVKKNEPVPTVGRWL